MEPNDLPLDYYNKDLLVMLGAWVLPHLRDLNEFMVDKKWGCDDIITDDRFYKPANKLNNVYQKWKDHINDNSSRVD